ncbi:MAG: UbiA [Planctomycetota bacterium]|nr:MAG: UbiA [Planctomycetota bacterium]
MPPPNRLLALARLVRVQNVFTAAADAFAGYGWTGTWDWKGACVAAAASACLYSGGLVLNDVCDADRDRTLHPNRPIPSGAIPRAVAFGLGAALLAAGILIAACIDSRAAAIAGQIALVAVAYDAFLKRWRIPGALAMGTARGLNFALGMAAGGSLFHARTLIAPAGNAVFIFLITLLSTFEEGHRTRRAVASLVVLSAAVLLAPLAWTRLPLRAAIPLSAAAAILLAIGLRAAQKDPERFLPVVVRTGVRSLIPLNAALLLGTLPDPAPGLVVLAFLIPTWGLGAFLAGS